MPEKATCRIPLYLALSLLGLAMLPYFINLGAASLWDANESFYAETPREMAEGRNFVIPLFNYHFRWQKPPLSYWGVAFMYRLFGVSEWSERIPIVLAACLWVGLAFWAGLRWFNARIGLYAGLFLALNFRVFVMSRRAITEIWLAFFVSLALVLMAKVLLEKERPGTVWMAAAWTALGLAVMTKGPVAMVLFGGTLVFFCLWKKSWDVFFSARFILSSILFFLVVLPWYIRLVQFYGWEPIRIFFLSDNFGRYMTEDFGPRRGLWYFLPVFLVDFFPWSLLGPLAWLALRHKQAEDENRTASSLRSYLWIWFSLGLIFFSLSRNKQEYYILPIYLPASLLAAYAWDRCRPESALGKNLLRGGFLLFAFLILAAAPLIWFTFPELVTAMNLHPFTVWILAAWTALLPVFLVRFALQCRWDRCLLLTIAGSWFLLTFSSLYVFPAWENNKPVRELARIIRTDASPVDWVGYYKVALPSLAFYMQRPIHEIIDEKRFIQVILRSPGRKFFILRGEEYERLQDVFKLKNYKIMEKRELWRWRFQELWEWKKDKDSSSLLLISGS